MKIVTTVARIVVVEQREHSNRDQMKSIIKTVIAIKYEERHSYTTII